MASFKKIWGNRHVFRYLFSTIYFNFHYLPVRQAFKLPILLYKPKFVKLKGKIIIDTSNIKTGMVKLGFSRVSIYPNNGIIFENKGGTIFFKGSCNIGNSSSISVGDIGHLVIGDGFSATTMLKLICYSSIQFKENVTVGWDNIFMDTDFHKMTRLDGTSTKGYGSILIGCNNWFGLRCTMLKNTQTPDFCTIASNSVLNSKIDVKSYSVIGGNPVTLKLEDIYMDNKNDTISYH